MSDIKNGGYAFPGPYGGMTLRDYFAAKALGGLCAALADDKARDMNVQNANDNSIHPKAQIVKAAYEYADYMLRAREAK